MVFDSEKKQEQQVVVKEITKRRVSMLNQLTILLGVIQFVFLPFFYFSPRPETSIILLVSAGIYFSTPFIARTNKYVFACYWYLLASFIEIYWLTLILGYRSGMFLPFISSSFLPLIFFQKEQTFHRRFLTVLPIVLVFGASMEIGKGFVEPIMLSPAILDLFRSGIICSVIVVIFQAMYLFQNETKIHLGMLNRIIGEKTEAEEKAVNLSNKLKRANENLQATAKAKDEFLSNMSHEIRTPMNAVIGMTYLALQTDLSKKQRNYIEKSHSSAEYLLGIINDILDFSKIEAGKLQMESVQFRIKDVLDNLVNIIGAKAKERNVKLGIKLGPEVSKTLNGDPLRFGQVLINITSNAVKFSNVGDKVLLQISLLKESEQEVFLHCSVEDAGIGMSPDQQDKLFKPFSQADGSTTRQYGGTGLGLVISKKIIQLMGGEICVESEIDVGSTFHFTVRLEKPDAMSHTDASVDTDEEAVRHAMEKLSGSSVLLVEDNEINQEIVIELLVTKGIKVTTAANGQEALDLLAEQEFDGVLMDCQMPVMDGFEATKKIREQERFKELPVIAMTANAMVSDQEKVLAVGMNDHIAKPLDSNKMYVTMAKWIRPKK